ncbi:MAG: YihA family ribosome biogenesis GTP-binding protein [Burkholderiales bacterium]|nr:YihA family ribosome biogenesis GTP-binding protein [Burkholderiales bacterium]
MVGARFLAGAAQRSQLPVQGLAEVAFAGRSNAGKSSAINALANHGGLAFASRTPGRTQQINFFALRSGALVADLPGYGYAAVAKAVKRSWQEFLWQYVATRDNLVALVLLLDARHGLTDLDQAVLAQFLPSGRPVLILATKADKLGVAAQREAVARIEASLREAFPLGVSKVTVQAFSATTRQGVAQAETTIASWLPAVDQPKKGPAVKGSDAGP